MKLIERKMPYKDKQKQKEYFREYTRRPEVRDRSNKRVRIQRKSPEGWAIQKYHDMKERCGRRKYYKDIKVLITKEEFIKFVKEGDWAELEQPSVDRIDSSGNYELGNIRIIEKKENDARSNRKHWGCMVKGCKGKHFGKGFCMKHYTRYIRRGTIDDMERFGESFDHPSEATKLGLYERGYEEI